MSSLQFNCDSYSLLSQQDGEHSIGAFYFLHLLIFKALNMNYVYCVDYKFKVFQCSYEFTLTVCLIKSNKYLMYTLLSYFIYKGAFSLSATFRILQILI